MIIITIFWDICVIQFNPSVTVSLVMAEIIPLRLMIPNILAQCAGATLAAYLAKVMRGYPVIVSTLVVLKIFYSVGNCSKVGAIPISEDADVGVILFAEVLFTFAMNFATVLALLGKLRKMILNILMKKFKVLEKIITTRIH